MFDQGAAVTLFILGRRPKIAHYASTDKPRSSERIGAKLGITHSSIAQDIAAVVSRQETEPYV